MYTAQVHIKANGKVNLSLSVGNSLESGLHPIESKMARITFFDDLEVRRLDDHALSRYVILWHEDAPRKTEIDWSVAADLSVRAHRLLETAVDRVLPIQMKLQKRIPVGGGLGGGSADAAAMLLAVSHLFHLDIDLQEIATSLGSDVPYLLHGGTCLVGGIGDVITPIEYEPMDVVLIIPEYSCSTAAVFRAFDTVETHDVGGSNDLLAPACLVEPRLAQDMETLSVLLDQEIHLSGSGSSMFAICDTTEHATELARKIEEHTELVAIATQTCHTALERT